MAMRGYFGLSLFALTGCALLVGACHEAPGQQDQRASSRGLLDAPVSTMTTADAGRVSEPGAGPLWQTAPLLVGGTKLVASTSITNGDFGSALAFNQGQLLVGSSGARISGLRFGAVYPFVRNGSSWSEGVRLLVNDRQEYDNVGHSVAASDERFLAGTVRPESGRGRAYVFARSASGWQEEARLVAAESVMLDGVGSSVALTADMAFLTSQTHGPPGSESGAVFVFSRSATTWTELPKLRGSDAVAGDYFGWSVDAEAGTLAVGARHQKAFAGAVYIFERTAMSWNEVQKLTPSDAAAGARFGAAVSLDGSRLLVGASSKQSGGIDTGGAYVFERNASLFVETASLVPSAAASQAYFGGGLALAGDFAVIAASNDVTATSAGNYQGAAYLFESTAGGWQERQKVLAPDGGPEHYFGTEVAVSGHTVAVAASGDDQAESDAGAVYVFGIHATGDVCAGASECASGHCSHGRCCDTVCDGPCERCDLGASVGTCSVAAKASASDGTCSPYLCDGIGRLCPVVCDLDPDCVSSHYCRAKECAPRASLGQSCSGDSACLSAYCADGHCCNSACDRGCERCDQSGAEGACNPVEAGIENDEVCGGYRCDGQVASCPSRCEDDEQCLQNYHCSGELCAPDAVQGDACERASMCQTGFCTDGACCTSERCNPYRCGPAGVCHPSCSSRAECADDHLCNSSGRCIPDDGSANGDEGGCSSGIPRPNAFGPEGWLLLLAGLRRRQRRTPNLS